MVDARCRHRIGGAGSGGLGLPSDSGEGFVLGDAVTYQITAFAVSLAEGITLGDSISSKATYHVSLTEGLILGETNKGVDPVSKSDGLLLGDTVVGVFKGITYTEGLKLGESYITNIKGLHTEGLILSGLVDNQSTVTLVEGLKFGSTITIKRKQHMYEVLRLGDGDTIKAAVELTEGFVLGSANNPVINVSHTEGLVFGTVDKHVTTAKPNEGLVFSDSTSFMLNALKVEGLKLGETNTPSKIKVLHTEGLILGSVHPGVPKFQRSLTEEVQMGQSPQLDNSNHYQISEGFKISDTISEPFGFQDGVISDSFVRVLTDGNFKQTDGKWDDEIQWSYTPSKVSARIDWADKFLTVLDTLSPTVGYVSSNLKLKHTVNVYDVGERIRPFSTIGDWDQGYIYIRTTGYGALIPGFKRPDGKWDVFHTHSAGMRISKKILNSSAAWDILVTAPIVDMELDPNTVSNPYRESFIWYEGGGFNFAQRSLMAEGNAASVGPIDWPVDDHMFQGAIRHGNADGSNMWLFLPVALGTGTTNVCEAFFYSQTEPENWPFPTVMPLSVTPWKQSNNEITGWWLLDVSDTRKVTIPGSGTRTGVYNKFLFQDDVPVGATIKGVEVAYICASDLSYCKDQSVQLYIGGSATGDNKARTASKWVWPPGTPLPSTLGMRQMGDMDDLWGSTPTAAQVRHNIQFGVAFNVENTDASNREARLGSVKMRIWYN